MYYKTTECVNSPNKIWISWSENKETFKEYHQSKLIDKKDLDSFIKTISE